MEVYNTLSRKKEEFKPLNPGKVGMYVCGPTVYNYIHIGNIRSFLTSDILRRYLEYCGYEVRQIKNITDVGHLTEDDLAQGDSGEDKIEAEAKKEKKTPQEIVDFYEKSFRETEKAMNILPANYFPKASAHIPHMIKMIEGLIQKGFAYEKNGNVFFDVTKFSDYGKLSGNTLENLKVGARLEEHPDKNNPWDFALWLKAPKEHLMKWESPWSLGYPGWHIECSVMSMEYLGATIDIHTGGEDNIFPHHEAEIAQAESYSGEKFVKYWVHTRHLLVDGVKMSKSKGNFYLLKDIEEKGFSAMALRLTILASHYRSQMNFTWDSIQQAKANLETLKNFYLRLVNYKNGGTENLDLEIYKQEFEAAMDDDLNTPQALTVFLKMANDTNRLIDKNNLDKAEKIKTLAQRFAKVLGLILEEEKIPAKMQKIAEERKAARNNKDFQKSDELRDKISELGYSVEDLKENEFILKKK